MLRVWLLVLFIVGCGKLGLTRNDLDASIFQHHNNLRWGRIANAAMLVQPKMREEFIKSWGERLQGVELKDIEVVGIDEKEDGADVLVRLTWIDRDTMNVKESILAERWVKTDDGWRVAEPAILPML